MSHSSKQARPPGPKRYSPWGDALLIQRDALNFTGEIWQQYGDIVRIRVLGTPATVLFHPDHIQYVLQKKHFNYDKSLPIIRAVGALLGQGLFTNNGDSWLHQRRLMQPMFHREAISGFGSVVLHSTSEMLSRWQEIPDRILDIPSEMARLALHVTCSALFSTDSIEEAESIRRVFGEVWPQFARYTTVPFPPLGVPTPRNLRIQRAARELDNVIYPMIERHRQKPPDHLDLLSLLLAAHGEGNDSTMTNQQIRDELVTMFVAGHETTTFVLSWFWYVLSTYPEIEDRFHCEVETVLAGSAPTVEHLPSLKYTRMVIDETMRLFSASFALGRHAIADDTIGGYAIPKDSIIFITPYYTHRHPDFWPHPERFDPERFSPEQTVKRHKFAYIPFGGGPRVCIGNTFALMEIPLIVASIAQRYRLRLVSGHPVEPWVALTTRPRYGLPMMMHPR